MTEDGIIIEDKLVQDEKAEEPIVLTFSPMVTDINLLQELKAESPTAEERMAADVKLLHDENAPEPNDVIEDGIVTFVKLAQEEKADEPIV